MNKDSKYYLVDTLDKFHDLLEYLKSNKGYLAIDTETTSEIPQKAQLLGISLTITEGEAFYIKFADFDGANYTLVDHNHEIRQGIIEILEGGNYKLLMFNSVYDVLVLERNIGVNAEKNLYADVILQKHLLDEEPPHGLKATGIKYLGAGWDIGEKELEESVLKNGGKWTADQKDFYKADLEVMSKYACMDADLTFRLFKKFTPELSRQNLADFFYNKETMPLNQVVIKMHRRGVKVDLNYYKNLSDELTKEAIEIQEGIHTELKTSYLKHYESLEKEILDKKVPIKSTGLLFEEMYEICGYPIVCNPTTGKPTFNKKVVELAFHDNPTSNLLAWKLEKLTDNEFFKKEQDLIYKARVKVFLKQKDSKFVVNVLSNDQLGELLFTYLGEKPIKKTDKGRNKVDEAVIESFEGKYKFIDMVLQFRKINKLLNTYVKAALEKNINGIIYPSWMQFGTTSGRFSSREPNYQNLPREDKRVKKGIIARTGYVLVGADYSQLEPRITAHLSKDNELINSYLSGNDIYGTIAVKVFNLPCTPNEVKIKYPKERNICKTCFLAMMYGAKEYKIAKILNLTVPKAKKLRTDTFNKFPGIETYIRTCHGQVITFGKIINETGRVRHLEGILKYKNDPSKTSQYIYHNYLNLSTNFPVQSLAASIINRAMVAIHNKFLNLSLDAHIIGMIHDEVICEVKKDVVVHVKQIIKQCMETTYKLKVPLIVDPKEGDNLAKCK